MNTFAFLGNSINWNGGQRITLRAGDTATCMNLNPGQLYAVFMYNSTQNDTNGKVFVNWSNSSPPVAVTIPGTTANAGLSSLAFVSGNDTQTISVSLPTDAGIAQIDLWLGSVSMPIDTSGINNAPLPIDGNPQDFSKYDRYYCVPPSSWNQVTIRSDQTAFISVQFTESLAVVNINREPPPGLLPAQIVTCGPTASAPGTISRNSTGNNSIQYSIFGNGNQYVWMNAASDQDSETATISLQAL